MESCLFTIRQKTAALSYLLPVPCGWGLLEFPSYCLDFLWIPLSQTEITGSYECRPLSINKCLLSVFVFVFLSLPIYSEEPASPHSILVMLKATQLPNPKPPTLLEDRGRREIRGWTTKSGINTGLFSSLSHVKW